MSQKPIHLTCLSLLFSIAVSPAISARQLAYTCPGSDSITFLPNKSEIIGSGDLVNGDGTVIVFYLPYSTAIEPSFNLPSPEWFNFYYLRDGASYQNNKILCRYKTYHNGFDSFTLSSNFHIPTGSIFVENTRTKVTLRWPE